MHIIFVIYVHRYICACVHNALVRNNQQDLTLHLPSTCHVLRLLALPPRSTVTYLAANVQRRMVEASKSDFMMGKFAIIDILNITTNIKTHTYIYIYLSCYMANRYLNIRNNICL